MLSNLIYWLTQKRWLIIAIFIGFVLYLLQPPSGLEIDGYRTFIIVIIAIILIVFEPVPLPAVALLILVLEVLFGIATPNEVASSFMSDAVFFIMGSLMLAVAIVNQGWDARIALGIIKLTGNRTKRIVFGFVAISAILSSFIGEHTVAAMMLPIGLTLIRYTNQDTKKVINLSALILFSIAYGSLIGSIGTPSGGGRNVIMMTYWYEFNIEPISYLKWMIYFYPLVLIQIPIASWILWKKFTPEYLILDSGVRKLKVQIAKAGKITGSQIIAALLFFLTFLGWVFLSEKYGLGIIALIGVILYLVTGLVKWEEIDRHVNWGVIILFGAAISLGVQINETGAAIWMASKVLNVFGDFLYSFSFVTDTIVVLLTTVLANIVSSSATVAILGPITMNMPGDPVHLGLVTAISSAFGYFTAVAAPACTIVYASGLVNARDFFKVGWKMGLISIISLIIYANSYWLILK